MYSNVSTGPSSRKYRSSHKLKSRKDQKLSKLIEPHSGSEDESEHELSYYINDRVKLMKEVLKIIKPRKIKSMAPECMKDMEIQEINSILLEELLGISNKRLKYIFEAKVLDEESSTDEDQADDDDVISLDSISDDDFVVISDDEGGKQKCKHKRKQIKEEPRSKSKKVKKEKPDKDIETVKERDKKRRKQIDQVREKLKNKEDITQKEKETMGEENLMSVLELLELQARARAIRSQLELESKKRQEEQQRLQEETRKQQNGNADEEDEIIIEVPQEVEIVITSSDSENESKYPKVKPIDKPPSPEKTSTSNSQKTAAEHNDESSQDSPEVDLITQKLNEPGVNLIHSSDKEDGEVSEEESKKRCKLDKIKNDVEPEEIVVKREKQQSDGSRSENLVIVKEREQVEQLGDNSENHDETQPSDTTLNTNEPENPCKHKPESATKLDEVVEEYMKAQSQPPDNSEELQRIEEEKKQLESKNEKDKKKKLKKLKNKLESFKQDVAVESNNSSSNVTVLENIVIKSKNLGGNKRKSLEHSDDLVINVDQDDYDCMICD
ncbi:pre-mRNA-splicing factor CWC22 homolog [Anthonomus grandis grandis]|uniref:pre-mRNA-splicing factor CWC22 homolog n=1 Tax=Anthonomus grandis grandis TaxID=2921223 RepID=UPI0021668740|nr:pre-mRNA-splicing factor CWC22 homolog [Anthonomus grandis grandis]